MALFKFRLPGQRGANEAPGSGSPTESVEVLRQRARHRLVGAAVLVLVGVVGFPLLFDTQPRPIAVDIPIDIPDKNKVKPLVVPAPVAAARPAASDALTRAETKADTRNDNVATAASLGEREQIVRPEKEQKKPVASAKPEPVAPKKEAEKPAKPAPAVAAKEAPKPAKVTADSEPREVTSKSDDGAKARALLDGNAADKPRAKPSAAADDGRFIVQVGAFADAAKARETRLKVEAAGLKTYTHVADTKDGKRIRVRVGPFDNKADADKAARRIKALSLPAAILTL